MNSFVSVVEEPCTFLQVKNEFLPPHSPEFDHSEFDITPETLNPVDMAFTSREFVFMVVDAVVFVPLPDERIISLSAVGVNGRLFQDLPLDDRQQLLAATVVDDFDENLPVPFQKTDDRGFTAGSASSFSPDTTCSKITFVNFNLPGKRGVFCSG